MCVDRNVSAQANSIIWQNLCSFLWPPLYLICEGDLFNFKCVAFWNKTKQIITTTIKEMLFFKDLQITIDFQFGSASIWMLLKTLDQFIQKSDFYNNG